MLKEPDMAKFRTLTILLSVAAAGLAVPSAMAGERQTVVRHHDLDLSTEAGQTEYKARVMRAVRRVCALPTVETLAERQDRLQCETRAKTVAMRKAAQTIARNGGQVKVALD